METTVKRVCPGIDYMLYESSTVTLEAALEGPRRLVQDIIELPRVVELQGSVARKCKHVIGRLGVASSRFMLIVVVHP